ncbi:hypothetical protein Plav_3470 [Parvibaculum lavamentivorans DS-1]|jgi:hypothetical protein|uniref:Uncharacterized protein n=1 Tax=Parvibaculum lavamentivorans (strain DS-1 / DSM 13023 / NCIMB 13966) TaxID=402881 RepID=A7HYT6_PARL1|nr:MULTISPECIES: DUF6634 family protein [Parvibaculum]ABS65069.1 hypothetical protein Plav_3470 [Parvibaculum lavamentivorans DS-1]MBX3487996.1 hypothetical protein [Parvibaculum sp.]MBX3491585.1 hypothetical protein [Parvibaculum sp.]
MVIYVGREGVLRTNHLNEELARLKELCVDLEWLRAGVLPSFEDLEDAPFIDDYSFVQRGVVALQGKVTGHPLLGATTAMTSDLCVFAPDLGWARTLSRFYRLGSPSPAMAKWIQA